MSAENVEIVKRIHAMWERGDFSSTDWADPEIDFVTPGPDSRVHHGIEEMTQAWIEWLRAWKDYSVEPREFIDLGDTVVVDQVFHGTGRTSGIPLDDIPGAAVITLHKGKVIRFRGYTTLDAALADARALP